MSVIGKGFRIRLDFHVGEITVFSRQLWLATEERHFLSLPRNLSNADAVAKARESKGHGYFVRSHPIASPLQRLQWLGDTIRYVAAQYNRYYVDLTLSYNDYQKQFSAKSRGTLKRKLRKFSTATGGRIRVQHFAGMHDALRFHALARGVSKKTYQERLLDAGMPDSPEFRSKLVALGRKDAYRGYILYASDDPVAYLYAPIEDGVLFYQFLGYDPAYAKLSPGTVLFWVALESMFAEQKFKIFDFTEGEGAHKDFFATGKQLCADVYFLRGSPGNLVLVTAHCLLSMWSYYSTALLDRLGIKAYLKRRIRAGGRW